MANWIRSLAGRRSTQARCKAVCIFCGKGIWSLMLYRRDKPGYAHTVCAKKYGGGDTWERAW